MGLLLKDATTGEQYKYFTPGENFALFKFPVLIDHRKSWNRLFREKIIDKAAKSADKVKPNTRWELVTVTNVNVDVYYLDE